MEAEGEEDERGGQDPALHPGQHHHRGQAMEKPSIWEYSFFAYNNSLKIVIFST